MAVGDAPIGLSPEELVMLSELQEGALTRAPTFSAGAGAEAEDGRRDGRSPTGGHAGPPPVTSGRTSSMGDVPDAVPTALLQRPRGPANRKATGDKSKSKAGFWPFGSKAQGSPGATSSPTSAASPAAALGGAAAAEHQAGDSFREYGADDDYF